MSPRLLRLISPVLSMAILTLGNGFFTTLTTVELDARHYAVWIVGVVSAAYYIGMMVGAYQAQRLVSRVGHIRAYAIFASIIAVSTLLQGVMDNPWVWTVARFLCGYSLAGLFVVIEGWVLSASPRGSSGRIFGIYLLIYYLMQALSQWLLKLHYSVMLEAFVLIAAMASLSVLPVCSTRFKAPRLSEPEWCSPKALFKMAPLGIVAALISGLLLAALYSIYPLYLYRIHYDHSVIADMMFAVILGGALLQYPIGKLSDHFDRRHVLLGVAVVTIVVALLILFIHQFYWLLWGLSFLLGGATFAIYPLSISHTNDYINKRMVLAAISVLTLMYGVGSSIGPLAASGLIHPFGASGLMILIILVALILGLYTLKRLFVREASVSEDEFINTVPVTPTAAAKAAEMEEQEKSSC